MSAAQSEARMRMLYEPGILYAAYSRYCDWIKIGFTSRTAADRVDELNHAYPLFAPFSLIGSTPGTHNVEQALHRILVPLRLNRIASTGELYPASPSLRAFVDKMLQHDQTVPIDGEGRREMLDWARRAAAHPLNRVEAEMCFERFRRDRSPLFTGRAA